MSVSGGTASGVRVLPLLRLYRPDVAFVTFCAALAGPYFSRGSFDLRDVAVSLFIALVPYYYVYALNSLTDRAEDAISHPGRPLPAGELSFASASRFVALLAVASVAGPLFLFRGMPLFLALLIPLLGTLYSAAPVRLKRFPLAAAVLTAWGLTHPFFITADRSTAVLGLAFLVIAAGVVIFKDLSDEEGDRSVGRLPLTAVVPLPFLCALSLLFSALGAGLLFFFGLAVALPLPVLLAAALLWHLARYPLAAFPRFIYGRLITVAVTAIGLIVLYAVGGMFAW